MSKFLMVSDRTRVAVALLGALGCNSLDERAPEGPQLFVPTDDRPAVEADVRPVALGGGTLHVTSDGAYAVAADEDRDQIAVVDLSQNAVTSTLLLDAGDRPARITEGSGVVYVALRGAGSVLALDPASGNELSRLDACKAPRGLSFDETAGVLHVACAEGRLVTLEPDGTVQRDVAVPVDVRDVMVRGGELWLTRFKSAEVVRLDASGAPVAQDALPGVTVSFREPEPLDSAQTGQRSSSLRMVPMSATVAWRAVPTAGGGAVIVHQESADDEVELSEPTPSGSAYGGGGDSFAGCGGIVRTAVSVMGPDGTVTARDLVAGAPLPVDVAVSPDGERIAIAHAGIKDPEAPRPSVVFPEEHGGASGASAPMPMGSVTVLSRSHLAPVESEDPCQFGDGSLTISDPAVAVAFTPDGRLLAQTRQPANLWVQPQDSWEPIPIALSTDERLDTGHEIFHRDSGGGIACASCHPEGGEDGHVWRFSGMGPRRSQALHVGLEGTAPFHWDGTLRTLGALMNEVFVGRMGGVKQSSERLGVLEGWLFGMEAPPPLREADDPRVARGDALFHSSETGCASCHEGSSLTNNESHFVGTSADGEKLQVPSLVAVGYRAPFMHDGCATTLMDRFDPACGGSAHGDTSGLTDEELSDLVAYLESL